MSGVTTPNLDPVSISTEVLVNGTGGTGRQKTSDLATQLIAEKAMAEKFEGLVPTEELVALRGGFGGTLADQQAQIGGKIGADALVPLETSLAAAQAQIDDLTATAYDGAPRFPDTTAGLVGTSEGGYFRTPSTDPNVSAYIYRHDAGSVATLVETIVSVAGLSGKADQAQVDDIAAHVGEMSAPQIVSRGSTSPSGYTASITWWSSDLNGAPSDGVIDEISIKTNAALSLDYMVVDAGFVVRSSGSFSVTSAGEHKVAMQGVDISAGSRLYVRPATAAVLIAQTAGVSDGGCLRYDGATTHTPGASVGGPTTSASIGIAMAVQYRLRPADALGTAVGDLQQRQDADDTSVPAVAVVAPQTAFWPVGTPNIRAAMVGLDAGLDMPVGGLIEAVTAQLIVPSTANRMVVSLGRRLTSAGDGQWVPSTDGAFLQTLVLAPADLGVALDSATPVTVTVPLAPVVVEVGYTYFAVIQIYGAALASAALGLGYNNTAYFGTGVRGRRRGWYSGSTPHAWGSFSAPGGGLPLCLGLICRAPLVAGLVPDRIDHAETALSGDQLTVAARIAAKRHGAQGLPCQGTVTIPLAAAGLARYDVIAVDTLTYAISRIAGIEAATTPGERIPALTGPSLLAVAHVRVTDAARVVVPVWDATDGQPPAAASALEVQRTRARRAIARTLAQIGRGDPVKIVGIGDSIAAWQSGAPSTSAPNGAARDRLTYLQGDLASDLTSPLTLYTAVQLGRADDGAGAVHVAESHIWRLVMDLRRRGATVAYDNFAIGATSTADLVTGSPLAATAWLTAALALSPDLLILHMGMNELGNAGTEARVVKIIELARAVGAEVLVMGVARRAPAYHAVGGWRATNAALARAASFAGAGFVDVQHLYEDDWIGAALGIGTADVSSANANNHPGLREHRQIGDEMIRLFGE